MLGSDSRFITEGRNNFLEFLNPRIFNSKDRERAFLVISRVYSCTTASTFSFCSVGQISEVELRMTLSSALGKEVSVEMISIAESKNSEQIKRVSFRGSAGVCIQRQFLRGERSGKIDPQLIEKFRECGRFGGFRDKVVEYLSSTPAFSGNENRIKWFTTSVEVIPLIFVQMLLMGKGADASKLERLVSKLTKCLPLGEDRNNPNHWLVAVA